MIEIVMVKRKARALTRDTRQTGKSDMSRDRKRKAIAPGKRRSKKGNIYYENRRNRSDVKGRDTPMKTKKRKVTLTSKLKVPLTAERKRRILAQYHKNEAINHHSANAVMLIRLFGTPAQRKKATALKSKIDKRRTGVTLAESKFFLNAGHVHYKKLLPKTTTKRKMSPAKRRSITKEVKGLKKLLSTSKKNLTPLRKRLNKKAVPIHNKNGVAREIMRQLGKPTLFMLGANRFVSDGNALIFFIKGSRKINRIRIALNGRDLYDVEFWKQSPTKFTIKVVSKSSNVYFDQLKEVIERHTGLSTRMPNVRFR